MKKGWEKRSPKPTEAVQAEVEGLVRGILAAFVDELKRYCRERGIELGLQDPRAKSE